MYFIFINNNNKNSLKIGKYEKQKINNNYIAKYDFLWDLTNINDISLKFSVTQSRTSYLYAFGTGSHI